MRIFSSRLLLALTALNSVSNVLAAINTSISISASTSTIEASKAAIFYSLNSTTLLVGNDNSAVTGGFRTWSFFSSTQNSTLEQLSEYVPGRTKLVTVIYDVGGKDLIATLTMTDSLLRLYDIASGEEVASYTKRKIWGDFSAVCGWKVGSGEQYLYFFGKKVAVMLLVRDNDGVEVVEIQTFAVPIEAEACTVSHETSTVFFGGENGTIFTLPASRSTSAPTVSTLGDASDEVAGLAIYTASNGTEYLLAALPETVEIYSLDLSLLGTADFSGIEDVELKDIALYQQSSALYPLGAIAFAIEIDDSKLFAVSSLENIFTNLPLTANTNFTPRILTCTSCAVGNCTCSGNGFCESSSTCDCYAGFAGDSCASITCENDCSSHGTCTAANICTCDSGWGGPDCSFVMVQPKYETDAYGVDGDDPAIWIAPNGNIENSRIITTTKSRENAGLGVFDLTGKMLQTISAEEPDNVDVIYGFQLGSNRTVDLAFAACRGGDTLCLFEITANGTLQEIAGGVQPTKDDFSVYGSCVYYSPVSSTHYLFVNSKTSEYLQYALTSTLNGTLTTTLVRSFFAGTGGQVEGCVGDSENQAVIIGEELYGLWIYDAEPDSVEEGYLIDSVSGRLFADVEGVTMVNGKNSSQGYIIVSCQGYSAYNVYRRTYPYDYILTFSIETTTDGLIDHVTNTDGLAAVGTAFNSDFPNGLVVVHDDANENPDGTVNEGASFKLVSLEDILGTQLLEDVDAEWDPRKGI